MAYAASRYTEAKLSIMGEMMMQDIEKETVDMRNNFDDTLQAVCRLRSEGYTIVSVEQTVGSLSLEKFKPEPGRKYAFIFGNEVDGVRQDVVDASDFALEIPQYGTKHSLNVSVSVGVVLWQTRK